MLLESSGSGGLLHSMSVVSLDIGRDREIEALGLKLWIVLQYLLSGVLLSFLDLFTMSLLAILKKGAIARFTPSSGRSKCA
jgi:hypothetical protein